MNTQKNEAVDEGAAQPASKSKREKIQLIHHSSGKIRSHVSAAYALASSKNLVPKKINWHESEWPELPKSSSSHIASEEVSHFGGNTKSKQPGLSSKSCDERCLKEKYAKRHKTKSELTPQGSFICPPKELEHITSSLSRLNISPKCHPHAVTKENVIPQQGCHKKVPLVVQRRGEKLFLGKPKSETLLTEKSPPRENSDLSLICDDDFPDLLAHKNIRKVRKKNVAPIENVAAKKPTKKYPRRSDPISINLGEVLEVSIHFFMLSVHHNSLNYFFFLVFSAHI